MKIEITQFETEYHHPVAQWNNLLHKHYVRHEISVYNKIIIDGCELDAVYQTAQSYIANNYSMPRCELELSEDGGTSSVLVDINDLCWSNPADDTLLPRLIEIRNQCSVIDSIDKLRELYEILQNNRPALAAYLPDEHSENIENYQGYDDDAYQLGRDEINLIDEESNDN